MAQEALIADKKGKCEQLGIRFEDEIRALPDPAVMQEIDMISLMGNLLDNAIEACQASGQEKPYLRFSSMIRKKVWMIEVSNSKSSDLSPKKRRHEYHKRRYYESRPGHWDHQLNRLILQRFPLHGGSRRLL